MKHIMKCLTCNSYTMNEICKCGADTVHFKPPKYSPEDAFGDYRRRAKHDAWKKEGLI